MLGACGVGDWGTAPVAGRRGARAVALAREWAGKGAVPARSQLTSDGAARRGAPRVAPPLAACGARDPVPAYQPPLADLGLTAAGGLDARGDGALDAALQAALSSDPLLLPLLEPRRREPSSSAPAPDSSEARRWDALARAVAAFGREAALPAAPRRSLAEMWEVRFLVGSPRRLSRRAFSGAATMRTAATPAPRGAAQRGSAPRPPPSSHVGASGAAWLAMSDAPTISAEFAPPRCSAWRADAPVPPRALRILDRLRRAYWAAVVGGVSACGGSKAATAAGAAVQDAAVSHGLLSPARFFTHVLPAALVLLAAMHVEGAPSEAGAGLVHQDGGASGAPGTEHRRAADAWWPGSPPRALLAELPVSARRPGASAVSGSGQLGMCGAAALCRDFLADVLSLPLEAMTRASPPAGAPPPRLGAAPTPAGGSLRARVLPKRPRRTRGAPCHDRDALSELCGRMPVRLVVLQIMLRLQVAAMQPVVAGDGGGAPACAPATPLHALPALEEPLLALVRSAAATVCLLGVAELARLPFLAATGESSPLRALLAYACRDPFGERLPGLVAAIYRAGSCGDDAALSALSSAPRAALVAALGRERALEATRAARDAASCSDEASHSDVAAPLRKVDEAAAGGGGAVAVDTRRATAAVDAADSGTSALMRGLRARQAVAAGLRRRRPWDGVYCPRPTVVGPRAQECDWSMLPGLQASPTPSLLEEAASEAKPWA